MPHNTRNTLKIAIAQLNPILGDIQGNLAMARKARAEVARQGVELIIFTELFIVGYPPEDLVLKPAFQAAAREAVETLAKDTGDGGPAMLVGTPWREGDKLYNAVALLDGGEVQGVRYKYDLPNYGVFDEVRIFDAGPLPGPINFRGVRIGVPICEDIWSEEVCECLAETGAEILLVPNGSPFSVNKYDTRMNVAVSRVTENHLPLLYANQFGGQDELAFDGASFVLNPDASLAVQLEAWREQIVLTRWARNSDRWQCEAANRALVSEGEEAIYRACVIGLRDYVEKNGFPGVIIGLSGGIDSALTAAICVDALGKDRVHCVMLPYHYTSDESLADADACANALGVRYERIEIARPVAALTEALAPHFAGRGNDTTEENLQSRVRGTILMALSNKLGSLLATTGNKSEVSVGYATLYGDMNGGFNPIKDLYKTKVYALSRFRNRVRPDDCKGPEGVVIPQNIITKAPTAELRENQTDQDSLPPYEVLDDILHGLVEEELPLEKIVSRGHDAATVARIERLLYLAEYKRRQAAPGVKISERNFDRDRRYPITNRFREPISELS